MNGPSFMRVAAGALGVLLVAACSDPAAVDLSDPARLSVHWHVPTQQAAPGLTELDVRTVPAPDPDAPDDLGPTAQLYVPEAYDPARSYPLLVLLHGAGGGAHNWQAVLSYADERGIVLLMPGATSPTWDAIHDDFGPDIEALDIALGLTFDQVHIDPDRMALAGFSDGGSYALAVGTANGDLFSHVVGWSPGSLITTVPLGSPPIFVSHGTDDEVIPISASRDQIVPALRARGLDVVYREFEGGHWIPFAIFEETLDWFLG